MAVVYIVTVFLVIALLLSPVLFPFWKVWRRLKIHHPQVWNAKGPFDLSALVSSPALLGGFFEVIDQAEKNEALKRDPQLKKWCGIARGVRGLLPRSFPAQVGYFLIFLYFTGVLTSVLLTPFKN